jgi:hypothetical protein
MDYAYFMGYPLRETTTAISTLSQSMEYLNRNL